MIHKKYKLLVVKTLVFISLSHTLKSQSIGVNTVVNKSSFHLDSLLGAWDENRDILLSDTYKECVNRIHIAEKLNKLGNIEESIKLLSNSCLSITDYYENYFECSCGDEKINYEKSLPALELTIDNYFSIGKIDKAKDYLCILKYKYPRYDFDKSPYYSIEVLNNEHKYKYLKSFTFFRPLIGTGLGLELGIEAQYKFLSKNKYGPILGVNYSFGLLGSLNTVQNFIGKDSMEYMLSENIFLTRHRFSAQLYFPRGNDNDISSQFFLGLNYDIIHPLDNCNSIYQTGQTPLCDPNIVRKMHSISFSVGIRKIRKDDGSHIFKLSPIFLGRLTNSTVAYLKTYEIDVPKRRFGFTITYYTDSIWSVMGVLKWRKFWMHQNFFSGKRHVQSELPQKKLPFD